MLSKFSPTSQGVFLFYFLAILISIYVCLDIKILNLNHLSGGLILSQNVIPMSKQLDYFREYKKKIEPAIGNQGIENHINNAMFVISAGTNDFVVNYYTVPVRRQSYNVSSYQQFLLQQVKEFIQVCISCHFY